MQKTKLQQSPVLKHPCCRLYLFSHLYFDMFQRHYGFSWHANLTLRNCMYRSHIHLRGFGMSARILPVWDHSHWNTAWEKQHLLLTQLYDKANQCYFTDDWVSFHLNICFAIEYYVAPKGYFKLMNWAQIYILLFLVCLVVN